MNYANFPLAKLLHHISVRPRLAISTFIGAAVYPVLSVLPVTLEPTTRALITWDIGAGLYLVLAWLMFSRTPVEQMRERARVQDDGAKLVLMLTVAAAVASLAAIVMVLSGLKKLPTTQQELLLGLVAVTFIASWLLVHTTFALHYAHDYYASLSRNASPPLEFPDQESPVYMDFLYFAMVIGMTSQTADVGLATTRLRRLVMAHGMIAFAFNTTLLALTVNIAADLLG
ncbi:DUF1345 domain-containing protein [uncultured Thiodictyon sp.]|uniref:DUF1345 domain-containing protein n=1 Tax=uncultured Thiodictyon sp. TaxID=1846217 RepID=UPI0025DEF76A|nr:DUF1345 domain-containing protein [uncultured Thiodictyon sp.]